MQAEIGRLDPLRHNKGTGALGRLADILSSKGYSVNSFPVDTEFKALEGKLNRNKVSIDSNKGFIRFNPADADSGDLIGLQAERINGKIDGYTNVFSETWSSALVSILLIMSTSIAYEYSIKFISFFLMITHMLIFLC